MVGILEIFLIVNAFILGAVVTLAIQYLMAHRRGQKTMQRPTTTAPLPPATRERIAKQAEANFQGIVNRSGLQLQHDLTGTSQQLNKLLEKFGSDVLDEEMRLFRAGVSDIRAATQGSLSSAQDQIDQQQTAILKSVATRREELEAALVRRQAELEAELNQHYELRQQDIAAKLNTKLNDAVMAFLLETLGHDVDLGAQTDYLLATLDSHKAELLGSVTPATQPTPKPRKA